MTDEKHDIPPATRIEVALAAIERMLIRASRVVNVAEDRNGQIAIMPFDTFRMNLMAIESALAGEVRAERLAVDDEGAAAIAEILHEAQSQTHLVLSAATVEQARQLYGAAARAGRQVEADRMAEGEASPTQSDWPPSVRPQLYEAVAKAAMMLGEILSRVVTIEDGERDAG